MHIEVVTLFPALVATASRVGVTGRAVERGQVTVGTVNPRDYAEDVHGTVDDRPYGGGPGMVMKIEPCRTAIRAAAMRSRWIVTSCGSCTTMATAPPRVRRRAS